MNPSRCGLYSFPKSGNTWIRIFLTSLFQEQRAVEVVPDIYESGINGKIVTDASGADWQFYKSHSRTELIEFRGKFVKNDLIVVILRNPLDVFCSQLNYVARGFVNDRGGIELVFGSVEEALDRGLINDLFSAFLVYGTLTPRFLDAGSWMENARYWSERAKVDENVMVLKYERLLDNFTGEVSEFVNQLGFSTSDIDRARVETEGRTNDGGKFFWRKSQGTYKKFLTQQQVTHFQELHSSVLQLTGYDEYYS